jgi:hypothetical protein
MIRPSLISYLKPSKTFFKSTKKKERNNLFNIAFNRHENIKIQQPFNGGFSMENEEKIISLLEEIDGKLDYMMASIPDVSKVESLLTQILKELKKE